MAIGVFDSGIGGMTVVSEIRKRYPLEKIIYFGDTKRVPYGGRDTEELIFLAMEACEFLIKEGAEIIIDACNTTSAVALPHLREKFKIPIIGVLEPGAKNAARVTEGRVGVIATDATIKSQVYSDKIKDFGKNVEVIGIAAPKLVAFVEDGITDGEYLKETLLTYLKHIFMSNCDTLVMGCTHYPFLKDAIYEVVEGKLTLIDPAVETVNQLEEMYHSREGESICYISGDYHSFNQSLNKIFPGHGFEKIIVNDPIKVRF